MFRRGRESGSGSRRSTSVRSRSVVSRIELEFSEEATRLLRSTVRELGEVTEDLSVRRCRRNEGGLSEEEVRRRVELGGRVFGCSEAVL